MRAPGKQSQPSWTGALLLKGAALMMLVIDHNLLIRKGNQTNHVLMETGHVVRSSFNVLTKSGNTGKGGKAGFTQTAVSSTRRAMSMRGGCMCTCGSVRETKPDNQRC